MAHRRDSITKGIVSYLFRRSAAQGRSEVRFASQRRSSDALRAAAALVFTLALFLVGAHADEAASGELHAKADCAVCFAAGPASMPADPPEIIGCAKRYGAIVAAAPQAFLFAIRKAPSQPRAPPLS